MSTNQNTILYTEGKKPFIVNFNTTKINCKCQELIELYQSGNNILSKDLNKDYARVATSNFTYISVSYESESAVCSHCNKPINGAYRIELLQTQTVIGMFHRDCLRDFLQLIETLIENYPSVFVSAYI